MTREALDLVPSARVLAAGLLVVGLVLWLAPVRRRSGRGGAEPTPPSRPVPERTGWNASTAQTATLELCIAQDDGQPQSGVGAWVRENETSRRVLTGSTGCVAVQVGAGQRLFWGTDVASASPRQPIVLDPAEHRRVDLLTFPTCTLTVTALDLDERPIHGAELWLAPRPERSDDAPRVLLASGGSEIIRRTDRHGQVTADLPCGLVHIFAPEYDTPRTGYLHALSSEAGSTSVQLVPRSTLRLLAVDEHGEPIRDASLKRLGSGQPPEPLGPEGLLVEGVSRHDSIGVLHAPDHLPREVRLGDEGIERTSHGDVLVLRARLTAFRDVTLSISPPAASAVHKASCVEDQMRIPCRVENEGGWLCRCPEDSWMAVESNWDITWTTRAEEDRAIETLPGSVEVCFDLDMERSAFGPEGVGVERMVRSGDCFQVPAGQTLVIQRDPRGPHQELFEVSGPGTLLLLDDAALAWTPG